MDVVITAATIIVTPRVVRELGTEVYGVIGLVSVMSSQLGGLQLGIGPAVTRLIAEDRGRAKAGESATITMGFLLSLATTCLFAACFWVVAPWAWTEVFRSSTATRALALKEMMVSLLLVGLQPLNGFVQSVLLGQERYGFGLIFKIVYGITRILAVFLAAVMGTGLAGVLWAYVLIDTLGLLAGLASLRHAFSLRHLTGSVRPIALRMMAIGMPVALLGIAFTAVGEAEKMVIASARSVTEFTYYSIPANAVLRLGIVTGVLSGIMLPKLARLHAAGEYQTVQALTQRATRISMAAALLTITPFVALAPELLDRWLGPVFAEQMALPSRVLLGSLMVSTSAWIASSALRASAPPRVLAYLYWIELPGYILVVYVLTIHFGLIGAATSLLGRMVLEVGLMRWLVRRSLGISIGRTIETIVPSLLVAGQVAACQAMPAMPGLRLALVSFTSVAAVNWLLAPGDRQTIRDDVFGIIRRLRSGTGTPQAGPGPRSF